MSKLFDALNQVKEERQRQSAPALPGLSREADAKRDAKRTQRSHRRSPAPSPAARQDQSGLWRIGYGLTAVLLVVAVAGSVFVNFKTMAGLENAKTMSLDISRHMDEQKQELAAIRRYWMKAESARKDQRQQIIVLQKGLKGLTKNLEEAKSHLAKIEDLRVNDKLMLGKFIALNDKVKKIEDGRWRMEDGKELAITPIFYFPLSTSQTP